MIATEGDYITAPHPGAQYKFLTSSADIVIYGGGAGGGKSAGLLLESIRHAKNPRAGCVIFRRTYPQIFNEGSLWDTSHKIYPLLGGRPREGDAEWIFPSGYKVKFAHLEHETSKKAWDGSQIPLLCFDELTSFSAETFWYMLSRNRSTAGLRPYVRCTCNPDADSWVADLIAWWIDQETGYAIPERSGVIRWFVRLDGKLNWFDTKRDAIDFLVGTGMQYDKAKDVPKSLTFILALLEDNPTLEQRDPGYRANLMALEHVERERLLGGNWKIRPAMGLKFPRNRWKFYDAPPMGLRLCRFWDKAATEGGKGARTAGGLMGELDEQKAIAAGLPRYWIVHVEAGRWGDAEREAKIKSQAMLDNAMYGQVTIGMETEGGSGGKHSTFTTTTNLAGYDVFAERPTTNKSARWGPLASQQQIGNVAIVKSPTWDWAAVVNELDALAGDEVLDKGKLKDVADALSGAFKYLAPAGGGNVVQGDLIASGDEDFLAEEHGLFTEEEKEELPEFWKELIDETDKLDDDRGRGRRTSWDRD